MRLIGPFVVGTLWVIAVSCDRGEAPLASGEAPKLTNRFPRDSEGLGCDIEQSGCGVPANRPLSFEFDRWLLPSTATRQSLVLFADGADSTTFLNPEYDLLSRTVTYRASGGLSQGLVYVLALNDAETHDYGWGFQSYDRRPLEREGLDDPVVFRSGPPDEDFEPETVALRSCRDALQAFTTLGCTSCHQSSHGAPVAGLGLDSPAELDYAIGRVAYATDRGGEAGQRNELPERFGMNMALIDAGAPAYSFLLYRILLRQDAYRNEAGRLEVTPPADKELQYAEQWLGAAGPMPPLDFSLPAGISPVEQVRQIEGWIQDGADTTDCD